jgi:hypothetical protein
MTQVGSFTNRQRDTIEARPQASGLLRTAQMTGPLRDGVAPSASSFNGHLVLSNPSTLEPSFQARLPMA